jgi:hypothetical protein
VTLLAFSLAASVVLAIDPASSAALVLAVPMGSAADFGVLGSSTVTNTGLTSVDGNVGVWSGTSVTGFPPGVLTPPGTIEAGTAAAQQAQTDLDVAYSDAAGRAIDTTTPAELGGQTLVAGVYGTPTKAPFTLTGSLVLDGGNDPSSVFIFQTDTTLTTASASAVTLINGAQECNVFWQIGSSATLGAGTDFAGSILAFTSITLTTGTRLRGRALAHDAAVTMDTNEIIAPTCDLAPPTTTTVPPVTTTTTAAPVTTTLPPVVTTTSTTLPTVTTTTPAPPATTTSIPAATTTTTARLTTTTSAAARLTTTTSAAASPVVATPAAPKIASRPGGVPQPRVPDSISLTDDGAPAVTGAPQTGGAPLQERHGFPWSPVLFAVLLAGAGLAAIPKARRG